jgi:hypothetical protein
MKSFKTIISTITFSFLFCVCTTVYGQTTKGRIPFYAEPYYIYDPLKITIGKYKKELLTKDTTKLTSLASKIKTDINNTDVESLYFLSIRLYDLGKKDDAFYWFHTAKSRARIFMNTLDPKKVGSIGDKTFELKQFFISCNQLVGEYLNGYGLNDIDKGIAVFEKVKNEVKDIQSYKNVYPDIQFLDDKTVEKEKTDKEAELEKTIDYIKKNREEIKKQRIANGVQDKY